MPTIKELRQQRRWTQLELANRLGVTPGTVASWERGRNEPRLSEARKIIELFGIRLEDLETPVKERSDR